MATHDGNPKHMADVLYVPTITKNMVSIGQMVEQGLQVKFSEDGCYVEDLKNNCILVARGNKVGRMFTLDVKILAVNDNAFSMLCIHKRMLLLQM